MRERIEQGGAIRGILTLTAVLLILVASQFVPSKVDAKDHGWNSDMPEKSEETVRKEISLAGKPGTHTIEVDNIFGSIEVVGTDSDRVELVAEKTIHAETKQDIELAKKEVTLDITELDNGARFYVNGPFRCQCDDGCRGEDHHRDYVVKYDFQLRVPANTVLRLSTVNDGRIKVQGVSGDYVLKNVNGGIEMVDAAGSGKVKTVNGPVKVTFRENPTKDSEFASLNGDVDLQFTQGLSADFRFKTFNGEVYSDYPLTALPQKAQMEEKHGRRVVIRSDRFTGGRVGAGGPEIKVENLNGDIHVLERRG